MSENKDLVDFLERQILIEEKIVDSLNLGIKDVENPPVKGVLKGISLDSKKHAELYSAAITLLTEVSQALTQKNLDEQKALVERHIQMEAELINKLEGVLPTIQNEKVKFLLNTILSDERRHHELLGMVLEMIVRRETITEDEWWEILWKNVPFHGAPGG
ncbi:ferritin-like domain-containing protein [Candidatus Bathyarchaeota archaeon]|nr:ferritin-like domain-containing protein [Candidatus Bathyarchaeota archaeon]